MRDIAALQGKLIATIYVDLVKAFDRLVRELVLGWPLHLDTHERRLAYRRELGIEYTIAEEIIRTIAEEGPALERMGATDGGHAHGPLAASRRAVRGRSIR